MASGCAAIELETFTIRPHPRLRIDASRNRLSVAGGDHVDLDGVGPVRGVHALTGPQRRDDGCVVDQDVDRTELGASPLGHPGKL